MTSGQIKQVEAIINKMIDEFIHVDIREMSMEDAKKTGEHVKNTSEIKHFKILSESGISDGVRRIAAITGDNVIAYYEDEMSYDG